MNNQRYNSERALFERIESLLVITAAVTTLAITPWFSYDPINLPKLLILSAGAFCLITLALFIPWRKKIEKIVTNYFLLLGILLFLSGIVSPILLADSPIGQQFWGTFGRNNGFLYHISLLGILIVAMLVGSSVSLKKRFARALLFVFGIQLIYGLLQFLGLDFVDWSSDQVFGTLGNPNFFSAFLGIGMVLLFSRLFEGSLASRALIISLLILASYLILETSSSQGLFAFAAGVSIVVMAQISRNWRSLLIPYSLMLTLFSSLTVFGLFNRGPLREVVFQETTSFRFDYWVAGLRMFFDNFAVGVGLDSYGDYYKQFRTIEAVIKTGPSRTSNSAHNIFIDLAASGGITLLLGYSLIQFLVLFVGLKRLLKGAESSIDSAIFGCWIAYSVQSLVSIGQIGISVWGWLLSGLVLSSVCVDSSFQPRERLVAGKSSSLIAPKHLIVSILGSLIGIALAVPPVLTDAQFRSAIEQGNIEIIVSRASGIGGTAWHSAKSLELALAKNDRASVNEITRLMIERYPRDAYALGVAMVLSDFTQDERERAFLKLKEVDPLNPEIEEKWREISSAP